MSLKGAIEVLNHITLTISDDATYLLTYYLPPPANTVRAYLLIIIYSYLKFLLKLLIIERRGPSQSADNHSMEAAEKSNNYTPVQPGSKLQALTQVSTTTAVFLRGRLVAAHLLTMGLPRASHQAFFVIIETLGRRLLITGWMVIY
jgi:hypothetical protein